MYNIRLQDLNGSQPATVQHRLKGRRNLRPQPLDQWNVNMSSPSSHCPPLRSAQLFFFCGESVEVEYLDFHVGRVSGLLWNCNSGIRTFCNQHLTHQWTVLAHADARCHVVSRNMRHCLKATFSVNEHFPRVRAPGRRKDKIRTQD